MRALRPWFLGLGVCTAHFLRHLHYLHQGAWLLCSLINNLGYGDDTILMAESEEEPKSLLMKVKVEWQIDGETMEKVTDFSWAPKSLQIVTAAMKLKDACSLAEKL